jgi:hypothetical protein
MFDSFILSQIAKKIETQGKKLDKHATHELGPGNTDWIDASATMEWGGDMGIDPPNIATVAHTCYYTVIGGLVVASYRIEMLPGFDCGTEVWQFGVPPIRGMPVYSSSDFKWPFAWGMLTCKVAATSLRYVFSCQPGHDALGMAWFNSFCPYGATDFWGLHSAYPFAWDTGDLLYLTTMYSII